MKIHKIEHELKQIHLLHNESTTFTVRASNHVKTGRCSNVLML